MSEENEEQDVGYKNPPEHSQFEEGNDAGVKHGLFQDYQLMLQNMSSSEKKIVGSMSAEFVEKYVDVHGEDPGEAEREMIRNLVLDTIKRKRANEYMFEGDYINFDAEARHNTYSRLRRDNREEVEALGLLDTPEAEKNREEAGWFEAMSNATEDEE